MIKIFMSWNNFTEKKGLYKNNKDRFYYGKSSEKERIDIRNISGVQLFKSINQNLLMSNVMTLLKKI